MQIKATMIYQLVHPRMTIIKKIWAITRAGENVEKLETLYRSNQLIVA